MMMRYYVYFLIELLLDLTSKLRPRRRACPRCGRTCCDGAHCGYPPPPSWSWPRTEQPKRYRIPVQTVRGSNARPIVVHVVNAPRSVDQDLLSKAMQELAEKHAKWVREQLQQQLRGSVSDADQELIRSKIAPALLEVCENEAARL